nr:MAG TPA: hypothetical protein [Myoviridae sp. ctyhU11]
MQSRPVRVSFTNGLIFASLVTRADMIEQEAEDSGHKRNNSIAENGSEAAGQQLIGGSCNERFPDTADNERAEQTEETAREYDRIGQQGVSGALNRTDGQAVAGGEDSRAGKGGKVYFAVFDTQLFGECICFMLAAYDLVAGNLRRETFRTLAVDIRARPVLFAAAVGVLDTFDIIKLYFIQKQTGVFEFFLNIIFFLFHIDKIPQTMLK